MSSINICTDNDNAKNDQNNADSQKPPKSISYDVIDSKVRHPLDEKELALALIARRLSLTSGARFETARRHKIKHRVSTISIIILTMYSILFSLAANLTDNQESGKLMNMISVFMSSFIAALTLYEYSKRYDARSESFLRCAIEMQCIRDRATTVLIEREYNWDQIRQFESEYAELLNRHTDNHSSLDYYSHKRYIGTLHRSRKIRLTIIFIFDVWGILIFAILSPAVVVFAYQALTTLARSDLFSI